MPSGSDDSDDEAQGPHHNESKQPPKKHGKHHHADQAGHPDQHHHHEKLQTVDGRRFEMNVVHFFKNDGSHYHLEDYKKDGAAKKYYVSCPGTHCTCSNKDKPISYDKLPPKLKDPKENLGSAIAVMKDENTDTAASIHPPTATAPSAPPAENPDYLQPETFHPILHRPISRTPSTSIWGFFSFCCGKDDAVPDVEDRFRLT